MSREIMWNYMKWLVRTGKQDTLLNFKLFKELNKAA